MIGSSTNNTGSDVLPMNAKAMEAELIQKATQTAIVAARSILMSGGTEESALKTAKAAAESVLNPAASDSDTVSGRSTLGNAFGGKRRKAKRQAEVVASMALMSATSLQPGGSNMMGDCDSVNKMYGRNIITVKQDEPSVLSGSTRPPKPPTPNSITSASIGRFSFKGISQKKEVREPPEGGSIKSARPPLPPTSPTTPQSILSSAYNNLLSGNDGESESQQLGIKTLSHSCSMDSENDSSVDSSLLDSSLLDSSLLQGRSGSEDESDEETAAFFFEKRKSKANSKSKSKKNSSWSFSDAFVNPFTATLNILHCGQGAIPLDGPRLEYRGKDRKRSGKRSGRSRARENSIVDSRDDTFDDDTAFSSKGRKKGGYTDADFPNSYSYDSDMTDLSEQDINIRSSIRETMESIVSKSRLSYRQSKKDEKKSTKSKPTGDKKWKSYESPRRKSSSVASATTTSTSPKHSLKSKKRSSAPKATRGRSFFRRK